MKRGRLIWGFFVLLVFIAGAFLTCNDENPPGYKPTYRGAIYLYKDKIEFDDGDTFLYKGKPIRLLGIDCPEVANPNVGIYEDQPYGRAAAESTKALISRADVVEIAFDGEDYYGRKLAHIFVDGELLSIKLLEMGLAYETVSYFGDNGFPDLAQKILAASLSSPKPPFEKPYLWRKKHQKRRSRRRR